MKKLILGLMGILCFNLSLLAQDLETFTMRFDDQDVQATQNIPTEYLGTYSQDKGSAKYLFHLDQNLNESFLLDLSGEEGWFEENKKTIRWGILVRDGKIVTSDVFEYEDGESKTYETLTLIYQNSETGLYDYLLLSQHDGQIWLGEASKITALAKQ